MGTRLPKPINENTERKQMGFDIPNGTYLVEVVDCEDKLPKKGGDKYLAVELEIKDAESEKGENAIGFKIFEQFSFSAESEFRLVAFLDACYPPAFKGEEIPNDIVERLLVVSTREEEYQGFKRPRCRSFKTCANWKGIDSKIDDAGKYIEKSVDTEGKSSEPKKDDEKAGGTQVAF